jgi:DNA polymerase-3 subunit gamma/tau
MQLASITFDGEKKNSKNYIIPPSYFINKGITPIPVVKPEIPIQKREESTSAPEEKEMEENIAVSEPVVVLERPKIILNREKTSPSGLSLSSIRAKKEHQIKQMEVVIDEENLPTDPFTESELIKVWNKYTDELKNNGKHNLASILSIDKPTVKESTIHLEFPNETNKVELERQQYELLSYVRKSLSNFDISLSISVNEVLEKKYAYTATDKYNKLKEKNPNIELLKNTFGLDV